jgi:peptidoglycan hydrolase-like protein with peptidoglycan-binding domain
LEAGSENEAVFAAQYLLREKFGFSDITVDGSYGDVTDAAVREFQADHELTVNGIVDPYQTWQALIAITP